MTGFQVVKLGILKFVLGTAFILSLIWTVIGPAVTDRERMAAHRGPAEVSPTSLFVLIPAAGFLAVTTILEIAAKNIVAAINSSPDATAQAMRRAVRPAAAVEQSPRTI